MAGKKSTEKSSRTVGRVNRRSGRTSAASALTQAPLERSQRSEPSRSRRTQPSADELGLRAWQTTYRNSKGKAA